MAKIFIDPGHGGTDSGAVGNGMYEKNINLIAALKLRDLLVAAGHTVKMSRETDASVDLGERSVMSNNWGADYFLSLHHNAGGGHGYEVIFSVTGAGESVASAIAEQFKAIGQEPHGSGIYSRPGSNGDYYSVLRETNAAQRNISEFGFIDTDDCEIFNTTDKLYIEAQAIAKGICNALGGNVNPAPVVLQQGSTGDAVKALQAKLIKLNYLPAGSDDGDFGPVTKAAVVKFQTDNALTADGIVGPITSAKLDEKIAALTKIMYRVILDGVQKEALSDQQKAIDEAKAAVDTGAAKEGKVQRNTDGVYVFSYTKPVPAPSVLYRIILDGKQVAAISDKQKAIDTVKSSVDNGQAVSGKVQQTDGVDIFTYSKPVPTPPPVQPAPVNIPKHLIMGKAECSAEQMAQFLLGFNSAPKVSCTAFELAQIFLAEGAAEGVRGDIAFAQSIHETGFFKFGGDVKPEQNNFAGIGTTGGGVAGATFPDVATGVRAQIQHLKAYGSTDALKGACVDPRYNLVSKGIAPNIEDLAGRWAVPGYDKTKFASLDEALAAYETYGQIIFKLTESIRAEVIAPVDPVVPPAPAPAPVPEPAKPEKGIIAVLIDLLIAFIKKIFKKGE
ncbi:MAG TPA: N-acetylmuramoyl-L-alanine amidase [Pseudoneobacillus sp.]|nr:N-acetylmuramoyl-L-alanine amidase [Pseudoneobacillus sp.]